MPSALQCPMCGAAAPLVRKPASLRQALWGGWTCPNCGSEMDRWGRKVGRAGVPQQTWTRDDSTVASNPGGLALSEAKLRALEPELYQPVRRVLESVGLDFPLRTALAEQLQHGDARAAVVVSVRPLLVAAYSDDLDCTAILRFPDELAGEYGLQVGSRLITVNGYRNGQEVDADLRPGPGRSTPYVGFHPLIADFLTDDAGRLEHLKAAISEDEWLRAYRLGAFYLKHWPGVARDGRPSRAGRPAAGDEGDETA